MNRIPGNNQIELVSIDPELDRLYREHAIAVALCAHIQQPQSSPDVEVEPKPAVKPLDECSSTFGHLE